MRLSVPLFKALQTSCNLFERLLTTHSYMSNTYTHFTSTWEITDLEQLQYDLCECSTKSQAPTLSVDSSSQVPLVAAENFRLERGKKTFQTQLYIIVILTFSCSRDRPSLIFFETQMLKSSQTFLRSLQRTMANGKSFLLRLYSLLLLGATIFWLTSQQLTPADTLCLVKGLQIPGCSQCVSFTDGEYNKRPWAKTAC